MCRFASTADPNYIKVAAEVRQVMDISLEKIHVTASGERGGLATELAAINASIARWERVRGMLILPPT